MSENTRAAYGRDLAEFVAFEGARGMTDLLGVTSTEIIAFLHHLKSLGKSSATGKPETGVTSVVFSLSDPCGDDGNPIRLGNIKSPIDSSGKPLNIWKCLKSKS